MQQNHAALQAKDSKMIFRKIRMWEYYGYQKRYAQPG